MLLPQVPFRPSLQPGESGNGYLLRISEALGYATPTTLTRLVDGRSSLAALNDDAVLPKLAHVLRQRPAELAQLGYQKVSGDEQFLQRNFHGHAISAVHLNYRAPRVCPACLKENNICLAEWDLVLVTSCPAHGCVLIDRCPDCGVALSWTRGAVGRCSCGCDLSKVATAPANPYVHAVTSLIQRAMLGSHASAREVPRLCNGLSALSLASLLRVIQYIGATFHPSSRPMTQLCFKRTNVSQAREVVETAGRTFADWPNQLNERLREAVRRYTVDDVHQRKLAHAFGNYYRHLFRVLAEREFDFLRVAFEDFAAAEWTGFIRDQHRFLSRTFREEQRWILAHKAAGLVAGTNAKAIRRLVQQGIIKGFQAKGSRGRQESWVDRKSLEAWAADSNAWMPRSEAEEVLGLKHETLMVLGHAGLLRFKKGEAATMARSWNFFRRDVEALVSAFAKTELPQLSYSGKTDEVIAIQHALVDFLGRYGLVKVIQAVEDGRLVPIGRANEYKGLRDYVFRTADLKLYRHCSVPTPEGGFVNMREAGRLLGVQRGVVAQLMRGGLLTSSTPRINGEEQLIPATDIMKFEESYVLLSRLAKETGYNSVRLKNHLARAGTRAIVLDGAGKRTVVYPKTDLREIRIPFSRRNKHG